MVDREWVGWGEGRMFLRGPHLLGLFTVWVGTACFGCRLSELAINPCKNSNLQVCCCWPTCCHCTPAETPPLICTTVICGKKYVDDVARAGDVGRQRVSTGMHQDRPVFIRDCEVVAAFLSLEVGELQHDRQPLLHLYSVLHPNQV